MMRLVIILYLILPFNNLEGQTLNPNTFGFCTTNAFLFTDGLSDDWINSVKDLNPKVLRFPGGNEGNFYHINGKGYGFNLKEVALLKDSPLKERMIKLEEIIERKQIDRNFLSDFIKLSHHLNTKVIIVANVLTGTVEETISLITAFKEENIEIVGVELGCELYASVFRKQVPNPEAYIDLITPFYNEIRLHFPSIKLGVVAAPYGGNTRHQKWNSVVSNFESDGVIVHLYPKINQYNISSVGEKELNQIDEYIDNQLKHELKYYRNLYNKEIWVTEWNIGLSKPLANTIVQGVLVSKMLLEFNLNRVELATFHNLLAKEFMFSMINPSWSGEVGEFQKRVSYYVFKQLSSLFQSPMTIEKNLDIYTLKQDNKLKAQVSYSSPFKQIDYNSKTAVNIMSILGNKLNCGFGINYYSREGNQYNLLTEIPCEFHSGQGEKIVDFNYSINMYSY